MAHTIKDYKLQLCGMFTFSTAQRKAFAKRPFYKSYQANLLTKTHVTRQYYPAFRDIILNTAKPESHLELISQAAVPFSGCSFVDYKVNGVLSPSPTFRIKDVSVTFYDERFGIGVYSYSLECYDVANSSIELDFDELTAVSFFARDFENQIVVGNETLTIAEFIEKKLLALDDNGNTINISEKPGESYFNGPKLKIWTVIDLPGLNDQQYTQALYELGTCTAFGTAVSGHLYSSSQAYFDSKVADQISVYQNWKALCLWDSFSLIGNDYKGNSFEVWNDNYFKVYKYNLYHKFYLFKVNSDLATNGKLAVTRKELVYFITKYDLEVISYNFLPNLLFSHMKKAMQSEEESKALLSKIDSRNSLLQEQSALYLNWFLGIIAVLSLVSIVGDASGLYEKLMGITDLKEQTAISVTRFSLVLLIIVIVILLIIYKVNRYKQNKHR